MTKYLFGISVVRPQPSSPFKRPLNPGSTLKQIDNCVLTTNGTNDGSSDSGNSGSSGASQLTANTSNNSGGDKPQLSIQPLQINNAVGGGSSETAFQSGQLPAIADVRSPDVLHPKNGPCDCLSHPIPVSSCRM